jgi:DedD protein
MAFFKFRLPTQNAGEVPGNTSNTPAESVEALRRRARHRLIGASVLVVVGVVGFPLLFDTQPRPVSTDIAVDIPDRAAAAGKSAKATPTPSKAAPLDAGAGLGPKEEVVTAKSEPALAVAPKLEAKPETKVEAKPEVKTEVKTESKAEVKSEAKPEAKAEVKEDKTDATNKDAAQRFVVQVGAFADEAKSREVRTKLEKAGFKTYTHVADTKEGKRTRVRVGPFTSRDEADKAASKIKQLQLQPQVLTL